MGCHFGSLVVFQNWSDPLIKALEYVIGDSNSLDGRLEAAQTDVEVYMASKFENQYKLLARS
ncbi:hypothetical protein HHK36_020121 [Tetracentron sinense]|uniref:Uncharacterized protein n=1 Tax=Tetracentron sinense TaxID=13715 RepID=A0A835DBC0_TETSI|nr:hypothetical protein HHK36_020121 [Tetracentron sinense]